MSKKGLIWGIVIIIIVILLGFGLNRSQGPERVVAPGEGEDVIRIGVLVPLTGDGAQYGESENRAIQVAVDKINNSGGIAGKKVELVVEDGKCDAQTAGVAAKRLIEIEKVKIIIGGACSGETLAAAKVTEPAKVILISPSATSPEVSNAGDFVFRVIPSDALAGKIAAKYAFSELGARKAALITELTDYAQGLREVYKQTFTQLGGEIVADETYNTGEVDFRTQVLKIKNSNPDVVYVVPQTATPGVAIFKQLREAKVDANYTTAEVLLDRQVVSENKDILQGVIGVELAVDYEKNPKAKALKDAHLAKFETEPGSFAANAYDAVFLIKEAIEAAGGLDTEKIRDWLYGVSDWPGAVGKINFDENGDPILSLNVRKISGGEVNDLGTYKP